MPKLVAYLVLFLVVGVGFILVHLLIGKLIRPAKPHDEKLTIYECGEPTIGSAWVQFDVRFYVVALLFVIFDVEVAFFFPWAVVFGQATELAKDLPVEQRAAITRELSPHAGNADPVVRLGNRQRELEGDLAAAKADPATLGKMDQELQQIKKTELPAAVAKNRQAARQFAGIAFLDILVFFGVLLVGFAYLWRRGDLQWVRSVEAERIAVAPAEPAQLVGV
jgi:NADH-quinone oxidoreductase subunit A